jgi:HlyD family secretion protein
LAGGTLLYTRYVSSEPAGNFKTSPVKRGDLLVTINSTGTVEPQEVIDVGAQVAGILNKFGKDPRADSDPRYAGETIDYNSPVEEGTVLALIDPQIYQANYDQAKAALDRAKADLQQMEAKRDQAEAEWNRAQKLNNLNLPSLSGLGSRETSTGPATIKGISDSDYVLAKANYEVAKANYNVDVEAIKQAEATLALAKTNLDYTIIKSPVKGTIIDRRMNVGQTVVAALNAPSLFLIAKDLHKMEVWASVNEADIGRIKLDMPVRFTVDAFPNDVFHGTVTKIRYNASMNQNVVLYTVEITTDNSELKLIPYLTADVKFEVDQRNGVLLAPNTALTWQPRPNQVAPSFREQFVASQAASFGGGDKAPGSGDRRKGGPGGEKGVSGGSDRPSPRPKPRDTHGIVWVKDEEFVRPLEVELGPTDGLLTDITGSEVTEGLEVVTGEYRDNSTADAKNPFAPQFFGKKR